jgi:hypothetical protein
MPRGQPHGKRAHASREPEFREVINALRSTSTEVAYRHLASMIPEGPWRDWAAQLVPTVTLEAVIAWLDAGQPEPDRAAERIGRAIHAVIQAAQLDWSRGSAGGVHPDCGSRWSAW